MLHRISKLYENIVYSKDSQVGISEDCFFDSKHWMVRYLLIRTGTFFNKKNVLIPPMHLGEIFWEQQRITLTLSADQIKNCTKLEPESFNYYHWPYYWTGAGIWGIASTSESIRLGTPPTIEINGTPCLRSTLQTVDYRVESEETELGYVRDFIFDDNNWIIRYLLVDTQAFQPPGSLVLLSPQWMRTANWPNLVFKFDFPIERILRAPEFVSKNAPSRSYEIALWKYYHKIGYWLNGEPFKKAG